MKSKEKVKGKHKLIFKDPTKDGNGDLFDIPTDILEDAAKNKILVDE